MKRSRARAMSRSQRRSDRGAQSLRRNSSSTAPWIRVHAYCSSVAPALGVVAVDRPHQRLQPARDEVLHLATRRDLAHLAVDDVLDHRCQASAPAGHGPAHRPDARYCSHSFCTDSLDARSALTRVTWHSSHNTTMDDDGQVSAHRMSGPKPIIRPDPSGLRIRPDALWTRSLRAYSSRRASCRGTQRLGTLRRRSPATALRIPAQLPTTWLLRSTSEVAVPMALRLHCVRRRPPAARARGRRPDADRPRRGDRRPTAAAAPAAGDREEYQRQFADAAELATRTVATRRASGCSSTDSRRARSAPASPAADFLLVTSRRAR